MEKTGDRSVRFTFNDKANRETPAHSRLLDTDPAETLRRDPEKFEQAGLGDVIGSAPTESSTLRPGERIIWERNPTTGARIFPAKVGFDNYDEISITYFLQVTTMFEAFKKGDIDIYPEGDAHQRHLRYLPLGTGLQFPAVHRGDIVKDVFQPRLPTGMFGLVFNTRRAVFADEKVTRSLTYAFDFEWMNKNILGAPSSAPRATGRTRRSAPMVTPPTSVS